MNRRLTRAILASITAAILAIGLTGCVNGPNNAASWLKGQAGVISVEVVDMDDNLGGSTGSVRGELDPEISDEQLASLVASVAGFLRSQEKAGIRLGFNRLDFWVDESDDMNARIVPLWRSVLPVNNVVSGLIDDGSVHVRSLRPDMEGILDELGGVEAELRIEGFVDAAAIEFDESEDNESGSDIGNVESLEYTRGADCEPPVNVVEVAVSLFMREELRGATLDPCYSFDLNYNEGVPFSTVLPALQAELVAAGLDQFPVTADEQKQAVIAGLDVTVTPVVAGDPAMFSVFTPFENAGSEARITVYDDRSVEITDYEVPLAQLVAMVEGVPAASGSPFIRIEGSDVAAGGLVGELMALNDEALVLAAASEQFTNIELNTDAGILALSSPVATDPIIPEAVADLRATGVWIGKRFIVTYLQTQLEIVDGVATVSDSYTDGHVVEEFAAEWNAGADSEKTTPSLRR